MANSKPNYLKWVIVAAIIVGIFLLGRGCGIKSVLKDAGSDTTIRKDSIVYQDRPVPYKVTDTFTVRGKDGKLVTIYDTLYGTPEVIIEPADTVAILRRFNETAYYQDIRDTGRAKITILDTVRQNRIAGRSVKVVFTDTLITNTITLRPPKRIIGYFTLSGQGNAHNPLNGFGTGLGIKTPNDMIYQAEWKLTQGNRPMGEVKVMLPIRIKR